MNVKKAELTPPLYLMALRLSGLYAAFVGWIRRKPPSGNCDQYSFFAQSSQSPLNGRFMFSIASMMSW